MTFGARGPTRSAGTQGPTGDNAVKMGMVIQLLSPGVKNGSQSKISFETVVSKFQKRLRSGFKQDCIKQFLISQHEGFEFFWDGKNAMKIRDGQETPKLFIKPIQAFGRKALGTMPVPTGSRRPMAVSAPITHKEIDAHLSGAAKGEETQDTSLV